MLLHQLHDLLCSDVLRPALLPQRLRNVRGSVPYVLRPSERGGVLPVELLRSVREWELTGLCRKAGEHAEDGSLGSILRFLMFVDKLAC